MIFALTKYGFILEWLGLFSVVTFVLSILLIPWLIKKLPAEYFMRRENPAGTKTISGPLFTLFMTLVRNVVGIFLLLAGIAMLFFPGQGILTILLGLSMTDFPGKYRLVDSLIARPSVRQALNWIRTKTEQPPFQWPNNTQ